MIFNRPLCCIVLLCSALTFTAAATNSTSIGFVRANGEFVVDASRIRNNSTLLDGAQISTEKAVSHVVLNNGTTVDFGLHSRGRVFRDHVLIENGLAQARTTGAYSVFAGPLRISAANQLRVEVNGNRPVMVTSLSGTAKVENSQGLPVAMVSSGKTVGFQSAQDPSLWRVVGCLQKVKATVSGRAEYHYVLRDETSDVVVELIGSNLEDYLGKHIRTIGTPLMDQKPVEGALYMIRAELPRPRQCTCEAVISRAEAAAGGSTTTAALSAKVIGTDPGAPAVVLGCLQKIRNNADTAVTHYVLRDEISEAIVEVSGTDLEQYAGDFIALAGSIGAAGLAPIDGAVVLIRETNVRRGVCCACERVISTTSRAASCCCIAAGIAKAPVATSRAVIAGVIAGTVPGIIPAILPAGGESTTTPANGIR